MRQLGSKLLAGGLSAGVILLWWPMFFPTDSVTTWLLRGIAWTLSFELLLVALSPFELALWSTHRGERLTRRVEAGRALLEHHSPRRRIGRRATLAGAALALPLALIAVGVRSHIQTHSAASPVKVTRVTRVVRVVKPVRVQKVVSVRTVEAQPSSVAPVPAPPAQRTPQKHSSARVVHRPTAVRHSPSSSTPAPEKQVAPSDPAPAASAPTDSSPQPTAPAATPPASGSQTS